MSWKAIAAMTDGFDRPRSTGIVGGMTGIESGPPPTWTARLLLPDDAPAELKAEAEQEADEAIRTVAETCKASSEHFARRRRLEQDRAEAVKKIDQLKAKASGVRQSIDAAHYNDKPTTSLEANLEQIGRELVIAEDRVPRLERLIVQAKAEATAELKGVIEAERQRQVSRLEGEVAKAASDFAGAAESLGGHWYVVSEARNRLRYVVSEARNRLRYADTVFDRFADAA